MTGGETVIVMPTTKYSFINRRWFTYVYVEGRYTKPLPFIIFHYATFSIVSLFSFSLGPIVFIIIIFIVQATVSTISIAYSNRINR